MKDNNIKYLVIGFLFALTFFVLLSAANDVNSQKSRYEHNTAGQILSILHTHTGVVKIYDLDPRKADLLYEVDYNK